MSLSGPPTLKTFKPPLSVGDVKKELDVDVKPQIYEPSLQETFFNMTILARTNGNPADMPGPVQRQIYALDKDQPVTKITNLETVVADALAKRWRTFAGVSGLLIIITLLASYLPANRAMKVSPLEALRSNIRLTPNPVTGFTC